MSRLWHFALVVLSLGLLRVGWVRDGSRRLVSQVVTGLLRLRSRPWPATGIRHCVVIAPHPDDETLGCGGAILLRRTAGCQVSVILLTDGSGPLTAGEIDADLVRRRQEEFRQATRLLGVTPTHLHCLNLRDGSLGTLSAAERQPIATHLARLLDSLEAEEVLVTSRDDGSSEHEGAYRIVADALAVSTCRPVLREYPVWSRWNPLLLLPALLQARRIWCCDLGEAWPRKRSAMAAYRSQTEPLSPAAEPMLSPLFVRLLSSRWEFFIERP